MMTYQAAWQILDWDLTVEQLRNEALALDLPDMLFDAHVQQVGDATWSVEDGKAHGWESGMYLVADVPVAPWGDPVLSRTRRASRTGDAR